MTKNDLKKYTKLGINKIRDVEILELEDIEKISNITNELQRVYQVKQMWRTETEMRYSVLNDISFPTPASKYWQCVREQDGFFQQLIQLSCEYQKTQGELELLQIEFDEIPNETKRATAQKKIIDAEIKQKQFALMDMRLQAHNRVKEVALWEKLKNELLEKADFDINDVNKHQKDSYEKRWQSEMNIGIQTNHANLFRHSKANLETLQGDQNE